MFRNSREEEVPRSVTLVVAGETFPPASALSGLRTILPVVDPPMVRLAELTVARFPLPVK